jgi:hypothetical protein
VFLSERAASEKIPKTGPAKKAIFFYALLGGGKAICIKIYRLRKFYGLFL